MLPALTRSARPRVARLTALAALVGGAVVARPAAAQTTESWSLCFSSAIGSCSDFFLTTTPTLDGLSMRNGTLVDVLVRHSQAPGVISGLMDFTFYFNPVSTDADAAPIPITPQAMFGAPAVPAGQQMRWTAQGTSNSAAPTDPSTNNVVFQNPSFDQFIGGCQGGNFDGTIQSPLYTCGAGAYRFTFTSLAQFDADAVSAIAVDVYAGDHNGDFFPDQAVCNAPTNGGASVGFDFGDFSNGDICRVRPASAVAAPEPASLVLLASGLLGVGALAARRRRRTSGDADQI